MHNNLVLSVSSILVVIGAILMILAALPPRGDHPPRYPVNWWYVGWALVALGAFGPFSYVVH